MNLALTEGGIFDDPTAVSNSPAGIATLNFSNCTEALFEYSLDEGPAGTIALVRLTPDELCAVLSEVAH